MTDERYTFVMDVKEKKRTARGYHNKVRQGGKMKLPSDYLTRKEKQALNGDIKTFRLNEPMAWDEYKALPEDLKRGYLERMRDVHGANAAAVREMLGICRKTLNNECQRLDVHFHRGNWTKDERTRWAAFLGETGDKTVETVKEIVEEKEPIPERPQVDIAALIESLRGTGAKLTIEVYL